MMSTKAAPFIPSLLAVESDVERHVTFEDGIDSLPDGVSSVDWHAMSDERRAEFMREKRKKEAFKTEMCKGYIRTGFCKYGIDCRFAHHQEELRIRPMHPKYKTELCLNFSMRGECGYGSRCQFIHRSPDSARSRSTSGGYSASMGPQDFGRSLQQHPNYRHTLDYRYQQFQRHQTHQQQLELQQLRNQLYSEGSYSNGGSDGSSSHGGLPPPPPLPPTTTASRFAMSAYVPRDRHPLFHGHPGQALRRHLETPEGLGRGNVDGGSETSLVKILSAMGEEVSHGRKSSKHDEELNVCSDFAQWNPFSGHRLFNENLPTTNGVRTTGVDYNIGGGEFSDSFQPFLLKPPPLQSPKMKNFLSR